MSVEAIKACRDCRHWQPLFTGEAWGVRSFADAPEDARAEIQARLDAHYAMEGYRDPCDAFDDSPSLSDSARSGAQDVPGDADWLYWGECALTTLDYDATVSLARAIDGSMYRAILRCRCNFGCVQWDQFST